MDILNKVKKIFSLQSMQSTFLSAGIIIAAILVGLAALLITQKNDSPVEQAAEQVLRTQGIDIDLSPDDE